MNISNQKTLLLVEDEAIIALSQKMFLEKYGYKVVTTNTGEKAIEILKEKDEIEIALIPESRKEHLEQFGYRIIIANTAEQAVEIFKENNDIDLVLMDIDLGKGMDGTQAAEIILKQRDLPLLFLSSHTEPEMVERTERITSYGYVVKDSSITVLDASIKMAFKLFDANKKIKIELNKLKKMDEMLRYSEIRYRRLFETTKDGILILDAECGMILDVNPFLIDLLGYSHESFLGKTVWDIGFLKDIIGNKDKFEELQKTNYVRYENLPLETADGNIIDVEFVSNVYKSFDANVIQCNIRVITERKKIETSLEDARKELAIIKISDDAASEFAESVINTVRVPLISLDQDLRVVTVSRSFYEVFKVNPEETVGQLIYDLGNKQWDIPKLRELLESILSKQTAFEDYEVEHDFASIGKRIMLLNARQIRQSSEKKKTILLAIEDITVRKAAEIKIQALLEEKDVILKEVHHRIKNSMSTVGSLLHLQSVTLQDPVAVKALKDTQSRVRSMMVLYDKLYCSSDHNAMSINDYLFSLIDDIVGNFPNSDLVTIEKKIGNFILDAKILQPVGIIVNELLTNIMKYAFTDRGKGVISVTASLTGVKVSIIVQDDGKGIPEGCTFENSSGFGFMLVKILAQQLGGSIKMMQHNGTKIVLEFEK